MNRRGFLSLLGAAVVAPLVPVPDLLLPTKTIFLPPRGGWANSQLMTPAMIANEALRILSDNLRFTSNYCIRNDLLIGRHDVLVGDVQIGVDHVLGVNFGEMEAKAQAIELLQNEITHRGLSTINIKRPSRFA